MTLPETAKDPTPLANVFPQPGSAKKLDPKVFDEPWQAQAFALTVTLHENGLFDWPEWAEFLSAELHQDSAKQDGSDYYSHWLTALEKLLTSKGLVDVPSVAALTESWKRAAHATPHGTAITLENDPAGGAA